MYNFTPLYKVLSSNLGDGSDKVERLILHLLLWLLFINQVLLVRLLCKTGVLQSPISPFANSYYWERNLFKSCHYYYCYVIVGFL